MDPAKDASELPDDMIDRLQGANDEGELDADEGDFLDPSEEMIVIDDGSNVPGESGDVEIEDDENEEGDYAGEGEYEDFEDDAYARIQAHSSSVVSVAFSPIDDTLVASGGCDDRGFLFRVSSSNVEEGEDESREEPLLVFDGFKDSVSALSFSSDGTMLAVGGLDARVVVYSQPSSSSNTSSSTSSSNKSAEKSLKRDRNGSSWKLLAEIEGPQAGVEWFSWHPRGPVVLGGMEDGSIWMWKLPQGAYMQTFWGHTRRCVAGSFTADGKLAVSASEDGTVRVWDPKTGSAVHTIQGFELHGAVSEGFNMPSRSGDNADEEYDDEDLGVGMTALAVHPADRDQTRYLVMTGDEAGTVCFLHADQGKVLKRFLKAHRLGGKHAPAAAEVGTDTIPSVECVGFSSKFAFAASGGMDGRLIVWDLTSMVARSELSHPAGVTRLAWHPEECRVWTACADGMVRLWDARAGTLIRKFAGHGDVIMTLAVSHTGNRVISGDDEGVAIIFDKSFTPSVE